jgi:hypothetical protein
VLGPALLLAIGTAAGCAANWVDQFASSFGDTVTVVEFSKTDVVAPPRVTLTIPDLGQGEIVLGSGDAPIEIEIGTSDPQFFVVGVAEDPVGVQSVCVVASWRRECVCGGIGEISQPVTVPACDTNAPLKPGDVALTRRWFPFNIDTFTIRACPQGCTGPGARLSVFAKAKNAAGRESSSATVTFVPAP